LKISFSLSLCRFYCSTVKIEEVKIEIVEIVRAGNVVVKVFWALNRDCISTVRSFVVTEVCLVVAVAVVVTWTVTRHTKIVPRGCPKSKKCHGVVPDSVLYKHEFMFDAVLMDLQSDLQSDQFG